MNRSTFNESEGMFIAAFAEVAAGGSRFVVVTKGSLRGAYRRRSRRAYDPSFDSVFHELVRKGHIGSDGDNVTWVSGDFFSATKLPAGEFNYFIEVAGYKPQAVAP